MCEELADINKEFSQSLSLGESVSYVVERSEKHAGAVVAESNSFELCRVVTEEDR